MRFEKQISEYAERKAKALSMGGAKKLEKRKAAGILNARERIDFLVDPGSFEESGLFQVSQFPGMAEKTPCDGKIAGFARIDGRRIGLVSNDFTVAGASSTAGNGKKMGHIRDTATRCGFPLVLLGESTGARMPDTMGAKGMASSLDQNMYLRERATPWANAVLGSAYGSSAWYACLSDFNVMRKGACMAVASAQLVSLATSGQVDPETLGGWKMHSEITGLADLVVDTDKEALEAIQRFLNFMPSHCNEAPPRKPVPQGSGEASSGILDILPEGRTKVYDVRKVINAIVDTGSCFELKGRYGKTLVTALVRIDGRSVGIIANNPLFKGGAIDADACEKACSFIVLCDSFNIPIVMLVDQPGFLIGIEAEKRKMPGKVINWMNALALCTVPKITIVIRKNYGQGYLNMGAGRGADELAAWWTAETSFMDPSSGVGIVFGVDRTAEPEKYANLLDAMVKETSAYDSAALYSVKQIMDPRDTRQYLKTMLDVRELRMTKGVGQHLMRNWPTTF
jgi:acetyl-CoA carboxylase carboxyltransferase component